MVRNEDKMDKDENAACTQSGASHRAEVNAPCRRATHIERPEKEVKKLMPELFISLLFLPWGESSKQADSS